MQGNNLKKKRFNKIVEDIKKIRIQGATNIAKAALIAYFLIPSAKSKKILLDSRPTEPMMWHVLQLAEKIPEKEILMHFNGAQDKINQFVLKKIKNKDTIFTHCHSTNVSKALIYAHKKGKRFRVFNTETRPLYQGRKTAKELSKTGIKVTMFTDSALATAMEKENKKDKEFVTKVLIGADALLPQGIINKIGSRTISEFARMNKIPVYVIADSWKFTKSKVPIEQRALNEIWDKAPRNVKIRNPSFEFVPKKYITKIISEIGVMGYNNFIKKGKSVKDN